MSAHVVIVGGGIAGLAAAERLTARPERGEGSVVPDVHVTLLEAGARLGGHIRTERDAGFLMEAGPDVFLAAKPAAVELCGRLGIADRIVRTDPRASGSFILRQGRLVAVPAGMSGLVPTRLRPFAASPLLSPLGKLRAAMEYVVPPRRDAEDESLEHFIVRRLGREMYVRLLEPLLSGMVAGDGAQLSVDATFPQLRELERVHGGLLRGTLAARRAARASSGGPPPAGLVSLAGGLGDLVARLEQVLEERDAGSGRIALRRQTPVDGVEHFSPHSYRVRLAGGGTLLADAVIVAVPAFVAAPLLEGVDESLAQFLGEIEYASTATISVAYPAEAVPALPPGTGYTVPRAEGRPVLACTFTSAKFAGRAPDGYALLRLFVGGAGRGEVVELPDESLVALARRELDEVLGIRAEPVLTRIHRLPRALPQYNRGHLERVARVEGRLARAPGLFLAGAAYRGVGIPDCIRSGERAADAVMQLLGARDASRAPLTGPAGRRAAALSHSGVQS